MFLTVPAMMQPMAATSDNTALQRLAALVKKRRVELRLHKSDVATAAGITINTYDKIEAAKPVRDVTYGKVEPVLRWPLGACRDVLAGATSVHPEKEEAKRPEISIARVPRESLEAEIQQAVQNAMIAATDLTAADIRRLNELVVEELRRRGVIPDGS